MIINQNLLDTLSVQAKVNPRLRQSFDLRNSAEDGSQRLMNALEPGTVMPIHRHMKTSESIAMIRGKMVMRLYDDKGTITEEFLMAPISLHSLPSIQEGECNEPTIPMVQVEAGQWHLLEGQEEGTVAFETKDGRYEPLGEGDIMK